MTRYVLQGDPSMRAPQQDWEDNMFGTSRQRIGLGLGLRLKRVIRAGGVSLLGLIVAMAVACSDDEQQQSPAQEAQPAAAEPQAAQQEAQAQAQQQDQQDESVTLGTIVDIAVADGRFETLVAALQAADLVETLQGGGPFTVFAPTDDAFAGLPEGTVAALLEDIPALTSILLYHVVAGDVRAADVVTLETAVTFLGEAVNITVEGDSVRINDSLVVIADIVASNGVIHVIDAVLLPPEPTAQAMRAEQDEQPQPAEQAEQAEQQEQPGTIVDIAVADGRFETLVAAVQAADLVETLQGEGPLTVFAPTDDAFAALPEGTVAALLEDIPALTNILLYHVVAGDVRAADVVTLDSAVTFQGEPVRISVEGDNVRINDSLVVIADIVASNGVIHVIDAVLLPPEPLGSIVDIALGEERFETLVAALQAAELVETLQGEGPFTVFAPTDDAFAALPEGAVAALLEDIPALTNILLYHVVAGDVRAADVVTLDSAVTVQAEPVRISVEGDNVRINDSLVVIADIVASNGVIHVVDAVLLPPEN